MPSFIGFYLHIPFCKSKCAYCDFFSGKASEEDYDTYAAHLTTGIAAWGKRTTETVTSVYFGGGTPSVMGTDRLCRLLDAVKEYFILSPEAEITLEVNPESGTALDFARLQEVGFNRLSVGLQSSDPKELDTLGRIHTPEQASQTVARAQAAGFSNISLDLMLAIPHQTEESLRRSIDFCVGCGVQHISCYLLKIEPGTRFYSERELLSLPDEDEEARLYLHAVAYLEQAGYRQYEISNFALPSFESRHNTLYWQCGEYIGIGPSAHSFYHGRRFHYERDISSFYRGEVIDDGAGGDEAEFIMLSLRLKSGLDHKEYERRFSHPLPNETVDRINRYVNMGLMETDGTSVHFTPKGYLVSNTILSDII